MKNPNQNIKAVKEVALKLEFLGISLKRLTRKWKESKFRRQYLKTFVHQ